MPALKTAPRPAPAMPELMTIEEVADAFRTSTNTVRYWVQIGKLSRPIRFGRRALWAAQQIRELLSNLTEAARGA